MIMTTDKRNQKALCVLLLISLVENFLSTLTQANKRTRQNKMSG